SFGHATVSAAFPLRTVVQSQVGSSEARRRAAAILRGVVIAAPILAVLVPLLLSADAVFAHDLNRFISWLVPANWDERCWRTVLVFVAVLTLGILGLWQRLMQRGSMARERAFGAAATVLVGMALIMLASAYQRMCIYEAAYGGSDRRLYVDAFIVCLGLTLAW